MTMKDNYHINFENFTLKKLQASLKKRKMIPSRVILKEDIVKRFHILEHEGIKNLKELEDQLKTKDKILAFSERSGIDADYLTVLKREVGSYKPNPVKLSAFPGIDQKTLDALDKAGVKNTKKLFAVTRKSSDIEDLSNQTGISEKAIAEAAALSDLARLYGVGPVFARIIYDVGVKSVKDFLKVSGKEFIKIYEDKTGKKADFSESDIDFSLEVAQELMAG